MPHRACDVCVILYKDKTPKAVEWCSACGKWKCAQCRGNLTRSAIAIAKTVVRRIAE